MKPNTEAKHTTGRCDLCGVKSKPGSQFEFMCRNSAACKRRRLIAAAPTMHDILTRLVNSPNAKSNALWDEARAILEATK